MQNDADHPAGEMQIEIQIQRTSPLCSCVPVVSPPSASRAAPQVVDKDTEEVLSAIEDAIYGVAATIMEGEGFSFDIPSRAKGNQVGGEGRGGVYSGTRRRSGQAKIPSRVSRLCNLAALAGRPHPTTATTTNPTTTSQSSIPRLGRRPLPSAATARGTGSAAGSGSEGSSGGGGRSSGGVR
jgi:hypothetical protein